MDTKRIRIRTPTNAHVHGHRAVMQACTSCGRGARTRREPASSTVDGVVSAGTRARGEHASTHCRAIRTARTRTLVRERRRISRRVRRRDAYGARVGGRVGRRQRRLAAQLHGLIARARRRAVHGHAVPAGVRTHAVSSHPQHPARTRAARTLLLFSPGRHEICARPSLSRRPMSMHTSWPALSIHVTPRSPSRWARVGCCVGGRVARSACCCVRVGGPVQHMHAALAHLSHQ